jgi:hypothetical protein
VEEVPTARVEQAQRRARVKSLAEVRAVYKVLGYQAAAERGANEQGDRLKVLRKHPVLLERGGEAYSGTA